MHQHRSMAEDQLVNVFVNPLKLFEWEKKFRFRPCQRIQLRSAYWSFCAHLVSLLTWLPSRCVTAR